MLAQASCPCLALCCPGVRKNHPVCVEYDQTNYCHRFSSALSLLKLPAPRVWAGEEQQEIAFASSSSSFARSASVCSGPHCPSGICIVGTRDLEF